MQLGVAIVHDYITQRGGAERVVLSMAEAFPEAPVYTSLYQESTTFPEFRDVDVRASSLNRFASLRRDHRLALPLLAATFSRMTVQADVVLCSSSGWAHGARATGRKVVYCHSPARWLYQTERYLGAGRPAARVALALLRPSLSAWDRKAALGADIYLANSTVVRDRIHAAYGIDAEVVPPHPALEPSGPVTPVEGIESGFVLCVSRLLPYKNVGPLVEAFRELPERRLVVVGSGPQEQALRAAAPPNVRILGVVDDASLRWLFANCVAVSSASHEDFGLTPLEGAAFGKPAVVLRGGGFLDTVIADETGVFFDRPREEEVRAALLRALDRPWDPRTLTDHAARFSKAAFIGRLRHAVEGA